jgi:hypothetical protein
MSYFHNHFCICTVCLKLILIKPKGSNHLQDLCKDRKIFCESISELYFNDNTGTNFGS